MHYFTMKIIEETDSEYKAELTLWENTDSKIYVQIGYDDNDPYSTQGICITANDARALINELSSIVKSIEGTDDRHLTLTPPSQTKTPSKVNWSK